MNSRKYSSFTSTPGGKIAYCGMLTALAMIFSYVESLIPINIGVPGIKLGLANLVVLTGLYYLRPGEVLAVSVSRILLIGFLFGNGMSILYSLAGGLLSFAAMLALIRCGKFSITGVSAAGGAVHNIGQLAAAMVILRSTALMYYLPVLIAAGTVCGVLMGFLASRVMYIFKG
ncbi:MAG: Gx transporter family protein [Lachnospiraceae bacterium]|nr:Gx transporter family protein [Lachnospiraceae bacterium]